MIRANDGSYTLECYLCGLIERLHKADHYSQNVIWCESRSGYYLRACFACARRWGLRFNNDAANCTPFVKPLKISRRAEKARGMLEDMVDRMQTLSYRRPSALGYVPITALSSEGI